MLSRFVKGFHLLSNGNLPLLGAKEQKENNPSLGKSESYFEYPNLTSNLTPESLYHVYLCINTYLP